MVREIQPTHRSGMGLKAKIQGEGDEGGLASTSGLTSAAR